MRATFYMKGGHVVVVEGVRKVTLGNDTDGSFSRYSIEWKTGNKPALFFTFAT